MASFSSGGYAKLTRIIRLLKTPSIVIPGSTEMEHVKSLGTRLKYSRQAGCICRAAGIRIACRVDSKKGADQQFQGLDFPESRPAPSKPAQPASSSAQIHKYRNTETYNMEIQIIENKEIQQRFEEIPKYKTNISSNPAPVQKPAEPAPSFYCIALHCRHPPLQQRKYKTNQQVQIEHSHCR